MRTRHKRSITIGILCVMLVFMGIGYAALQQLLTINTTGNITGNWKIEITSITPESVNEGVSVSEEILPSKTEGSFTANLKKPTDAVIYTVTVENKGTIDAVLESITPEDYTEGDIKYTTTGKEECKNLDANTTCDFTIKVEYLDTGVGQTPTPNGTKVEQQFEIKYVQEGASVNTPGGSGGGEIENTPAITVDSNGLVTGYNREKLTNDEGYVVIPATTEDGEKIVSIDNASFSEYNVAAAFIYNQTTDEELEAVVVYDEENYDAIETYLVSMFGGEAEASQTSTEFNCNINPTNLTGKKYENQILQRLATDTAAGITIYSESEFNALLKEMESTGSLEIEYEKIYLDYTAEDPEEAVRQPSANIEKLDLTRAIYLKTIESSAFEDSLLETIRFSSSIEEIGAYAFAGTSLSVVDLPNSLKSIGEYAFNNCSIVDLTIPNSVKSIGRSAFSGSDNLLTTLNVDIDTISPDMFNYRSIQNLILGKNVKTIGEYAFANNQITNITIPAGVTTIGNYAFANNQITQDLNLLQGLKTIGDWAFSGNKISKLTIPEGVTSIGINAFSSNNISETLSLPESIITVGEYAFANNSIVDVFIPEDIVQISAGVFSGNKISKLTIPKGVTTIGDSAFSSNNIINLTIPSNITTLGSFAFAYNNITNLTIPNSVATIGRKAFDGENNLLTTLNVDIETISYGIFDNKAIKKLTIGPNVKEIVSGINYGEYAFNGNQISELTFIDTEETPSQLTKIGENTFWNNQISGEVIIPSNVTHIDNYAFANNQIDKLIISNKIVTIGQTAFINNQISDTLIIPSSLITIGNSAFANNQIENLFFEDNETNLPKLTIENGAFSKNRIKNLTIPSRIEMLGAGAFSDNQIIDLVIPNISMQHRDFPFSGNLLNTVKVDLEIIDDRLFGSTAIQNLTIGSNVKRIEPYAFRGNQISESTLVFEDTEQNPSKLTYLSGFDYNNFTKLPKIPSSVTTIGYNAFSYNELNSEIIIPLNITTIEGVAFFGNSNLTKIIIKKSNSNEMTLASSWNEKEFDEETYRYTYYEVEYNPNYVG